MDLNIKVNEKNHLDIGGADAIDIAEDFMVHFQNIILTSRCSMHVKQIPTSLS